MAEDAVKPSTHFDLGEIAKIAGQDVIWAIRGKSINAYSTLEQSLFRLFQCLLRTSPDRASIVFFRITNTMTRNAILEKLIRKQYGQTYNLFWNSYLTQLRTIDLRRNEIVHWTALTNLMADGDVGITLVPPAFWNHSPDPPTLDWKDLSAFIVKCDTYARLCTMFVMATGMDQISMRPDEAKPWLDIFQQPLIYPLPSDHLLLQQQQIPENQPAPSPE